MRSVGHGRHIDLICATVNEFAETLRRLLTDTLNACASGQDGSSDPFGQCPTTKMTLYRRRCRGRGRPCDLARCRFTTRRFGRQAGCSSSQSAV